MNAPPLDYEPNKYRKFSTRIGFSFPMIVMLLSAVFALLGIMALLAGSWVGLVIVLVCAPLATSTYGFQMDWPNNRCREYGSNLWIKHGSWISLETLPDVAILSENTGYTHASMSNRTITNTDTYHAVYLLSESHRTRTLVHRFKNPESAATYAREFAAATERNFTSYQPRISAQTRRRR